MIKVVRISGESFDLESGKEIPKALVLSNGIREILIPVDEEIIVQVIQMTTETSTQVHPQTLGGNGEELEFASPVEPDEDKVKTDEPGSEYDDSSTGVGSL